MSAATSAAKAASRPAGQERPGERVAGADRVHHVHLWRGYVDRRVGGHHRDAAGSARDQRGGRAERTGGVHGIGVRRDPRQVVVAGLEPLGALDQPRQAGAVGGLVGDGAGADVGVQEQRARSSVRPGARCSSPAVRSPARACRSAGRLLRWAGRRAGSPSPPPCPRCRSGRWRRPLPRARPRPGSWARRSVSSSGWSTPSSSSIVASRRPNASVEIPPRNVTGAPSRAIVRAALNGPPPGWAVSDAVLAQHQVEQGLAGHDDRHGDR